MTIKNQINTEKELLNIVEYIKKTWILPENMNKEELTALLKIPFEAALNIGNNWCKNTKLTLAIYDLYEQRYSYLKKEHNEFLLYDGYYQMISNILDGLKKLEESALLNWNYEKFCDSYISQARKQIGNKKLHPKTYGELKNLSYQKARDQFEDFDTLGYWDKDENGLTQEDKEKALFKGTLFENLGSFNFIGRTTLHYILQSDTYQGRDPLNELISAVITQGLNIAEFNNTVGAIEIIKSFELPEIFQKELPELPEHKFLKACYFASDNGFNELTPETEKQIIDHKKHIASLTPEELKKREEEKLKKLNAMIDSIVDDVKNEDNEKPPKKNLTLTEVYKIFNIDNF